MKISNTLDLPVDAVTQKIAMLGRTGSGKSYASIKLIELMLIKKAQVVVIDPVGIHWGIRLNKDGKTPSRFKVIIFGGLHGDIPIEPNGGSILADFIVERNLSAVIDVSQFEHDTERARFLTDFGSRLFYLKKKNPSAICLVLEESEELIPQNVQRGEEKMLQVYKRIWKLGRNFGIGGIIISQRPQDINKKALNQTECVFAFQLTGSHERKAMQEWIKDKELDLDLVNDLPKLKKGFAHVWSPAWLEVSKVIHISEKETFDASSTPKVGKNIKSRPLGNIDLKKLGDQMKATIEKAKENDPALLKKEIAELKLELKKGKPANPKDLEHKIEQAKNILTIQLEKKFNIERSQFDKTIKLLDNKLKQIREISGGLKSITIIPKLQQQKFTQRPIILSNYKDLKSLEPYDTKREFVVSKGEPRPEYTPPDNSELNAGQLKILKVIAQYPEGLDAEEISVNTSFKSTSRKEYTRKLVALGYAVKDGKKYYATQTGIELLGDAYEPIPTQGSELQIYWQNKLTGGELKIFQCLLRYYPEALTTDQIMQVVNYKGTSTKEYLRQLSARKIIVRQNGKAKVNDKLFK